MSDWQPIEADVMNETFDTFEVKKAIEAFLRVGELFRDGDSTCGPSGWSQRALRWHLVRLDEYDAGCVYSGEPPK